MRQLVRPRRTGSAQNPRPTTAHAHCASRSFSLPAAWDLVDRMHCTLQ